MSDAVTPGVIQKMRVFWKWLSRRDELPEINVNPDRTHGGRTLLAWLTAPESLPRIPPTHHDRGRRLSWLLSPESLPNPDPHDAPESSGVFHWLVKPERLPPPPANSANKEAS